MKHSQVTIGLINPKSPTNVGAVMRAAGCFQADSVYYTGVRYTRAVQYNTDTRCIDEKIPLIAVDDILAALTARQDFDNTQVICVEFALGAIPLPEFQHPSRALYLFGPEDGSISQEVIDQADAVVYIPTIGSLNLASSVNVLLYDRLAKSELKIGSDELIKRSRCTNNNVKVKDSVA